MMKSSFAGLAIAAGLTASLLTDNGISGFVAFPVSLVVGVGVAAIVLVVSGKLKSYED